jgi:hypothetical protein
MGEEGRVEEETGLKDCVRKANICRKTKREIDLQDLLAGMLRELMWNETDA